MRRMREPVHVRRDSRRQTEGADAQVYAQEVEIITAAVNGCARCAVVVAGWTGLSLAELRGLKWEGIDFANETLTVSRTVWHT